ncbi:MAG: hypothetical protein JWM33_1006, partial [Caulobacteraceae bacterium]|nr:hypothetical protein [Caulobacteraceae bacterium]
MKGRGARRSKQGAVLEAPARAALGGGIARVAILVALLALAAVTALGVMRLKSAELRANSIQPVRASAVALAARLDAIVAEAAGELGVAEVVLERAPDKPQEAIAAGFNLGASGVAGLAVYKDGIVVAQTGRPGVDWLAAGRAARPAATGLW